MCVIDRPDTPSRHCAILAELSSSITTLQIKHRRFQSKVAWYKATTNDKLAYSNQLSTYLANDSITKECDDCTNVECDSILHKNAIDDFCNHISNSCLAAEQNCIPYTRPPKQHAVVGWKEKVEPLRQTAMFWHKLWIDCDCQQHGAVADVRRKTRKYYHDTVRECMKNQKSF